MKKVFIAEDGTQFDNQKDCIKHEKGSLVAKVADQHGIQYQSVGSLLEFARICHEMFKRKKRVK